MEPQDPRDGARHAAAGNNGDDETREEAISKATDGPAEDSDSASTESDMPQLLPVGRETERVAKETWTTHTTINRAAVEAVGQQDKEGLIAVARARPTIMLWFNNELRRRHGVTIVGYDEFSDGETAILVREEQPATTRRCKHDGQLYTLGETLDWALTRRMATVEWVLEFWNRDFRH